MMPGAVAYDEYGRPIDPNALALNRAAARPAQEADTVYGSTAPAWTPGAYNAAMMDSATGYANGGAVRQNFRRGGGVASGPALELKAKSWGLSADEDKALRMYKQQEAQDTYDESMQNPAAQQQLYDEATGTTHGTNVALGGAGSVGNSPGSMQALADYSGVSAGYAEGGVVEDPLPTTDPYASFANTAAPVSPMSSAAGLGYAASGRAMGQPAADDDGQAQADANARQAAKPLAKGKRGKKKKGRTGYAEGGAVWDDASQNPEYELQRRLQEEARQQQELAAQRQAQQEQRPSQTPTRASAVAPEPSAADVARQQSDTAAMQTRDVEPPPATPRPTGPAVAPQPDPADVARQQSDTEALAARGPAVAPGDAGSATPWYKQVYDHLANGLEQAVTAGTTGYSDPRRNASALPTSGTAELEDTFRNALNPFYDPKRSPYLSNPISEAIDSTKDRIHRFLNGEGAHSVDEISKMISEDPNRNPDQHIQKKWDDLELSGNKEEAGRLLQTIRNGMNSRFGFASAAMDKGEIDTAMHAFAQGNNLLPNGMLYTPVKSPDGQYGFKITPQKPGMGEEKVIWGSPAQMRDLIKTSNPDNILQNGLESLHGVVSGQAKEAPKGYEDPRATYANRPGYSDNRPVDSAGNPVISTANGFHPDSHMGLMDRAQEAAKYGRSDPEAEQYLARARALVRSGVAPADVPDALRRGVDPFAKPAEGAAPTNAPVPGGVTRGPDGKIVYDPIYDIPGSRSPTAPSEVTGVRSENEGRQIIGPGDSYTTREATRNAQSTESHEGKGGSGSKQSTDSSRDVSTALYPKEHWTSEQPREFLPYAYGERRAGSQAQGRPEDYAPISKMQGPPVPPGFQPPQPSQPDRDIFQEVRTPGRALPTAPRYDAPRTDKETYNAQLQELRGQVGNASTGTAYDARNRKLNEDTGYAAGQDRRAAELKRATAESEAAHKAYRAEEDRVRSKYGYYTPELSAQDKAGQGPPIRYTDDWRHVPRPPTQAEQAEDIKYPRQLQMKTAPAEIQATGRENVAGINQAGRQTLQTAKDKAAGERVAAQQTGAGERVAAQQAGAGERVTAQQTGAGERVAAQQAGAGERVAAQQAGAGERTTQREEGRNLRAADVMADRRANRQFLDQKHVQDLVSREGSEDMKQSMSTLRTKLQQGIKPDQAELDNLQILQERVQQQSRQPAAPAPAAAPAGAPASAAGPVKIASDDEYSRLTSGTMFIDPNGILRRKP